MRIPSSTSPNQLGVQLETLATIMNRAQKQIASGQRVFNSDDNPVAFRQALNSRADQLRVHQFQDSIHKVEERAALNLDSASTLHDILGRASEIGIRANSLSGQSVLTAMASEINGLLDQAFQLSNRQSDGQFLFGGTSLQPTDIDPATLAAFVPFTATRVGGEITAVTYRGDTGLHQVEIDNGSSIDSNIVGSSAGTPPGLFVNGANDVFAALVTLRDDLRAGNLAGIQGADLTSLRNMADSVASQIGTINANFSRLQVTDDSHASRLQNDEQVLSQSVDADLTQSVLDLQRTQTAYQAALQAAAKVLDLSLLNFLR